MVWLTASSDTASALLTESTFVSSTQTSAHTKRLTLASPLSESPMVPTWVSRQPTRFRNVAPVQPVKHRVRVHRPMHGRYRCRPWARAPIAVLQIFEGRLSLGTTLMHTLSATLGEFRSTQRMLFVRTRGATGPGVSPSSQNRSYHGVPASARSRSPTCRCDWTQGLKIASPTFGALYDSNGA